MKVLRNCVVFLSSMVLATVLGLSCEKAGKEAPKPAEKAKEAQPGAASLGPMVVAAVNGKPISAEFIEKELERYPDSTRNSPSIRKSIVNRYVEDQLLAEESERRNLDKSPEFVRDVTNMKVRLLKEQLMKDATFEEEEVKKYYDEHPNEWNLKERAHVFQILTADEQEAKKALARLKKGEKFEDVAREVSIDPRAKSNGGDLNYVTRESFPDVAEAIFKLRRVGELSPIVKSARGCHIFKLVEQIKPAQTQTYDEVSKNLRERLLAIKKHKQVQDFVQGLKETSQIVINDDFINAGQPATPPQPQPLKPPAPSAPQGK